MKQPRGFVQPSFPNYVYQLKKSLYRLKQTSRPSFITLALFYSSKVSFAIKFDTFEFVYCVSGITLGDVVVVFHICLSSTFYSHCPSFIY